MRVLPWVFAVALLVSSPAWGEPGSGSDVWLSAGASFRHTSRVDLAAIGGSTEYGVGDDASPGALSFEMAAGVVLPISLELATNAWLGVGGLHLSRIERRYFASESEPIGSSLSIGAGASARHVGRISPDLRLFIGPAVDWRRMSASSPAGAAHLDLLGFGLDVGARWRLNTIGRSASGHLALVLGARREVPIALWLGRSRSEVLIRGVRDRSDPIYAASVSVAWLISFDDLR